MMVRRNHSFIANLPRGHAANCAPYSTPLVRANIAAFLAKRPPLVVWPPPLPWEHSSRWSSPSLRGSSHSDADHAWVHLPAVAARSSAGAVGFRERSEDGDLGQTFDLGQQLASLGSSLNRSGHGPSDALESERWKTDSW